MSVKIVEGYHDDVRVDVAPYLVATTGSLLDVGGGTGATAAYMKKRGLAGRVGVADQVSSDAAHPDIDFHRSGNLDDPAFVNSVLAEGPFDTILCLDILEHLIDPWSVVAQLHQGLAPGGRIVASIPNVRHYRVSGRLFFKGRWELQDAGILDRTHLRFFVRDTAVDLMTRSGLTLELVETPPRGRHHQAAKVLHKIAFGRLDSLVSVDYIVRVRRDY